jgi:hypothetical protein
LPHEYSEGHDRGEPPEDKEADETPEDDESSERVKEVVDDANRELEHEEEVERVARESLEELEEMEFQADRAEEIAREASEELRGIEEELGEKLEDVREELHEEFVNDMKSQLEGPSLKESKEASSESESDGENSEAEESSQSYIEGGDGTAYVIETGSESDSQVKNEVEVETEEVGEEEHQEAPQVPEDTAEEAEPEESVKVRNSITHHEHFEAEESEETVAPSESAESRVKPLNEEESSLEESIEEPTNEHPEEKASVSSETEEEVPPSNESFDEEAAESTEVTFPETIESINDETEEAVEQDAHEMEEIPESSMEIEYEEYEEVSEHDESDKETVEVPEDIIRKIEELLEELNELEDEEVDESRVIIDSMTGEQYIDHSLEPRPYFAETEEDREQEEEERIRERLRELFSRLTEEERELFKESVRPEIESEEELEELVKRWRSRVASPDLKQHVEDARHYLRNKKKGEVPPLIRELRALEVERLWAAMVREAVRRSLERNLARAMRSQGKHQQVKKKRKTGYHRGREHAIRLHRPMCGKRPAGSFESYRKWLERNYPGLCERSDYPSLLEQVRKFFELRAALKGRKIVPQFEVDEIGVRLGLKKSTAREWVLYGHVPHLFKIVDSSMSAREARRLLREIVKKAGGISGWSELELWLKLLYPDGAYKRIAQYKSREERVKEFFAFLRELERGGSQKGIARRSGISVRRVRAFTAGEIPWLIRHVLAQKGELAPSKRYRYHLGSTYKVKIRLPKVRGKEVRSYAEFKRLVDRQFPWLKERSDYERLMRVARAYFDALREFGGKSHVTRNELVGFVKKYRLSVEAVAEWFKGKSLPMVFNMLENALTVAEAKKELKAILAKLNGVTSFLEYNKRMKTFYLLPEMKALPNYKKEYGLVKEFFRFLEALEKGGLYTDIIRRGQLRMGTTKNRRLYSGLPRLIRIATSIPSKPPKDGQQWLPLIVTKKQELADFVEAPMKIQQQSDLQEFLKEMVRKQRELTKEESETNLLVNEFMYLLGLIASDGSFGKKDGFSSRAVLKLSKKYAWSIRVGNGFCKALDTFGIKTKRGKDREARTKKGTLVRLMSWESQHKPLFHWMRRTLLGMKIGPKKRLRIGWILRMNPELIVPFLQGVADGDGHASVRSLTAGIATKYNKKSYKALLNIFGIQTVDGGGGIIIAKKESLKKAAELPLFRYADSRLFRLKEAISMIAAMKHSKVSTEERKKILEHYREGLKANQIVPLLWAELGTARRSGTIQKVIDDSRIQ